jgi:hypothetical protein
VKPKDEQNYIELVCKGGESILVPRLDSYLPQSIYFPIREPDKVSETRIRHFVRNDQKRVYVEE